MKAFVAMLACLAITASAVPLGTEYQSRTDEIKEFLARYDPARISDVSLVLLDAVTVTLASASVSGFSKFTFPEWSNDGENIEGTFELATLAANVDSLNVELDSGLTAAVPALDASVDGLTVEFKLSYTTSPLRLTSLSALLQVKDVSVEGSVKINDLSLDLSVGSEVVERINSRAVEAQERVSRVLMNVVNRILAIVDP
ncbi:uncharacterized protein LOC108740119 [Agrilus planipennis]|uniref:Uncharacterized protein LOC108740119 n=1 Tax=Agrilus planipennis TaxID=224129 RepID=A0A1W4XBW5_AGRPL|nr:uncharacterized protein LOC108740119 [Agrilus planipennis]